MTRGRPIDLIITVMTGYLKRFIDNSGYERPLDQFFGSPDWRALVDLRATGEKVTFRALLDYYEEKLKKIEYRYVDDDIRILNSRESTIYHLIWASKHPRGAEFFKKISRRKYSGQGRMEMM
jgi:three-Cys-motif partner protein